MEIGEDEFEGVDFVALQKMDLFECFSKECEYGIFDEFRQEGYEGKKE